MIIDKCEDESGKRIFSDGDRAKITRRLPMSIVLDIMAKMQSIDTGDADAIKSEAE